VGKHANYRIIADGSSEIVIEDVGPWSTVLTVTNDAEYVIADLARKGFLNNSKMLLCYDSDGALDVLRHKDGQFLGFECP